LPRDEEERVGPTRDIFFLNSFAGDYSSAITTLTKRETAEESGRAEGGWKEGAGDPRLPLLHFEAGGNFTARNFDERGRARGGGTRGGPFELLMREELSRLLSINFGNYVAEGVPAEESHPCPSRLLPLQSPGSARTPPADHSYYDPRYP